MDTSKPQPQRFQTYTLLPGGKTFTIKDSKFVFKLDRYGGWRDEYGHYYNSQGQPDFQPEDAELTPSEGSVENDHFVDDYDEYEPDIDENYEQDKNQPIFNSWEVRNLEKIHKNLEILSAYPFQKPLRVYFSNMPFKQAPKSVYENYSKKVKGIVNIIFYHQNNRRNGQGYFIMGDKREAQQLIKLEGKKVLERQVHFEVQPLDHLVLDPIKKQQTIPFWNPIPSILKNSDKNDDIPRFKAAPIPSEKKQCSKSVEEQFINKKEEQPQFQTCTLNFQIFKDRNCFFDWLSSNNYKKDENIKNITKTQNNGKTIITLDAKRQMIKNLKGKKYNGKEVLFTPI